MRVNILQKTIPILVIALLALSTIAITGSLISTHGRTNLQTSVGPDFSITAVPNTVTFPQGFNGSTTLFLSSLNGFSGTVNLSASPFCSGSSCPVVQLLPNSITLASNGNATSIFRIFTTPTTTLATYTVTVVGSSGSLSHSTNVTFTISSSGGAGNFTIQAFPTTLTLAPGATGTSTIYFGSINGFTGTVALSTTPLPACPSPQCPTWSIKPTSVKVTTTGNATATLTITSGTQITSGNVTVTGTSGSLSHSVTVKFVSSIPPPPDFSISALPSFVLVPTGFSNSTTISLTSKNGFSGTVTLAVPPNPACPGCPSWTISPNNVTLSSGGSAVSTLTIFGGTVPTSGNITVTGTSGSLSHSVTVSFQVVQSAPPDFAIMANPTSLGIAQSQCANSSITVLAIGNFSGNVTLVPSSSSPALTVAVNPTIVSLRPNTTSKSTLTVCSSSTTPGGTYTATVKGTSGSLLHSVSITVTVQPAPDFTLFASPGNLTIAQGSSGQSTINVTSINNFAGTILLTASVSITGPTTSLNPMNITLRGGGTANSILTFTATSSTPGTLYLVTVTGKSATSTLSHHVFVGVRVTAVVQPDFTITANPTQLTFQSGGSASSTITISPLNGLNATVNLTTTSTSGITVKISPSSIIVSGTATLTVTSTTPGNYTVMVTGTSGPLNHTATVVITVTPPPPPPDFTLTVSPSSQTVARASNSTAFFMVTITGRNGFNSTVHLSAVISPIVHRGPALLLPSTVGPYSNSTLTVVLSQHTPLDTYTIMIAATSGTITHTATVTVTVIR